MFECNVMACESVITRVNSFVAALINMVYELKITSVSKKNCL